MMNDAQPFDDEVIADSEDDGEMDLDLYRPGAMGPPPLRATSPIYGNTPQRQKAVSSISNYTAAGPSNHPTYTSIVSATSANANGKGKNVDTSIDTFDTFATDFENISASTIADRAKTRQRSQRQTSDVLDFSSDNESPFAQPQPKAKPKPRPKPKIKYKPAEPDAQVASGPTSGAGPVAPAAPAPAPAPAPVQTAAPRPRPKPRPIARKPLPVAEGSMAGAPYPPTSTPPAGPELPIATSPVRYAPSELPPSDLPFPVSSASTTYNDLYNNVSVHRSNYNYNDSRMGNSNMYNNQQKDESIPRIEAIRNSPSRPSSPNSLFSERAAGSSGTRRRQVGADTDAEAEIDQLATPPSPHKMAPPPTFFAGSSSSSNVPTPRVPAGFPLELEPPEPSLMIIEGPSTVTVASKPKPKPKPKPKKPSKSTIDLVDVDAFEYEFAETVTFGARPVVLDDDDMDDDFDPKGDGSAKKKKGKEKAKAKPKEKKGKVPKEPKSKSKKNAKASSEADALPGAGSAVDPIYAPIETAQGATKTSPAAGSSTSPGVTGRQQVEVVITSKPKHAAALDTPKEAKAKKGKGKGKEKAQEVFKSREFIEESDDDMDLLNPPRKSSSSNPATGVVPSPRAVPAPETTPGASAKPNDDRTPPLGSSSSSKKRPPSSARNPAQLGDDDDDMGLDSPLPKSSSSAGKQAARPPKKKRKSIVESDEDDDGDFQQVSAERIGAGGEDKMYAPESSVSAAKKRKVDSSASVVSASAAKSKKGKKKSTVVLSDEEDAEGETGDASASHGTKKGESKSKKNSRKIVEDEEDEPEGGVGPEDKSTPPESDVSMKENVEPPRPKPAYATPKPNVPSVAKLDADAKTPLYLRYEIAPRKSGVPMSELIRRANSIPGSPFATPHANTPVSASSKLKPLLSGTPRSGGTAYSPYMKASRSMLSRIAPLHPNRRTPPPPPPPPPPRKKSKKELELEEKWEEEMIDDVGGMEAWAAMGDDERREMRKAKWARELGGWDD